MTLKESETLELKRSTSELKEGVISIASILNKHQKGQLYFGIKNDGTVVGQQVGKDTVRDISQAISNHIQPKIYPKIESVTIEGRDCILVEFDGTSVPYYAYGRVYMRTADEDKPLSPGGIEKIILGRNRDKLYWDNQPSKAGLESINENILRDFIDKARRAGRLDFEYNGVKNTLNKLGLLENGKLLKTAELLFCDENPLEFQTAIFAGTDKTTFLDINQFKGNLFDVLKETELYIKNHMRWSVTFGKLEREEIPEIPIKAIREALVNSLCHRDYLNLKGNEVAIFKDRIEIYNPGTFPEGLNPEDFIKGEERSVLRNPLLANTLYLSKDIERWGSGLRRIYTECEANDVNVEFKPLKTGFIVVFGRKEELGEKLVETGVKARVRSGEYQKEILTRAYEGVNEGVREGVNEGVKQRLARELVKIYEDKSITRMMMEKTFEISTATAERDIALLKEADLILFEGPPKTGRYVLTEKGRKILEETDA
ncbi:MAG: ATP-binding protein [Candidatus Thermoplasmatota archaeon]